MLDWGKTSDMCQTVIRVNCGRRFRFVFGARFPLPNGLGSSGWLPCSFSTLPARRGRCRSRHTRRQFPTQLHRKIKNNDSECGQRGRGVSCLQQKYVQLDSSKLARIDFQCGGIAVGPYRGLSNFYEVTDCRASQRSQQSSLRVRHPAREARKEKRGRVLEFQSSSWRVLTSVYVCLCVEVIECESK